MPRRGADLPGPDVPSLGLDTLDPPRGGMERLLAKRALRVRGLRVHQWLPVAACAVSLILVSVVVRGPSIDVEEVRRQLTVRGTTLQIEDQQRLMLEQRAVAAGVHVYAVRGR